MKTYSVFVLAALLAATSLSQVAPQNTPVGPKARRPIGSNKGLVNIRVEQSKALRTEAAAAEAKGDFVLAENLYRRAVALRPGAPALRFNLARLYDKLSREKEALVEYRAVVAGSSTSWSTKQEDPRVIARYGDLAAKFGSTAEAEKAYTLAAHQSHRDEAWSPNSLPRNDSLMALKAAAHTASAMRNCDVGNDVEEMRELDVAVAADGQYWVARFYRARAFKRRGQIQDAVREATAAESFAPSGKSQELVRKMREDGDF